MTQGATVLLVAEASAMRSRLSVALSAAGYRPVLADTLVDAQATLGARKIALAAARLDPDSDLALAFARGIASTIPLVALLDRTEAAERLAAAAIRLDDMVFAPFASAEVTARIKGAFARRAAGSRSTPPETLAFSGWTLDVQAKTVTDPAGRSVHLTPSEFLLLETLVRRAGRVQSRDQLLDAVVGREAAPFDRTIDNLSRDS